MPSFSSWLEDALESLRPRLTQAGLHRLAVAIGSAVGIESLVWLTDIAAMSREDAADLMRWSAQAMLHHALADNEQNLSIRDHM